MALTAGTYTIAPSGGDYTSMSAWESDIGDVTAEAGPIIAEFETFSGGLDDNEAFVGTTTDSVAFLILRNAPGHLHTGAARTGFFFDRTGAGAETIRPVSTVVDTVIDGLAQDEKKMLTISNNGTFTSVDNCLAANGAGFNLDPANTPVNNSIVINGTDICFRCDVTGFCDYNTVIGSSNRGIVTTGSATARNCISVFCTTDFDIQSSSTLENCLSEDATAVGTDCVNNATVKARSDTPLGSGTNVVFENITSGSEDGRLVSDTFNSAEDAGQHIAALTVDYEGDARDGSTPDMGFDEIAAAAATVMPPDFYYKTLLQGANP